jgi:hypothetical protein
VKLIPPEEPQLLSSWLPLIRFGRRARLDAEDPGDVNVDDFRFRGRVPKTGTRPPLLAYELARTGNYLLLDEKQNTYCYIPYRTGDGGRIKRVGLDEALWRTGVPFAPHVGLRHYDDDPLPADPTPTPAAAPRSRRRRPFRPLAHPYLRPL